MVQLAAPGRPPPRSGEDAASQGPEAGHRYADGRRGRSSAQGREAKDVDPMADLRSRVPHHRYGNENRGGAHPQADGRQPRWLVGEGVREGPEGTVGAALAGGPEGAMGLLEEGPGWPAAHRQEGRTTLGT